MLVITVALAITAYGYISGLFTQQTSELIELADATCNTATGQYFAVVRNLDQFKNVSTTEIIISVNDTILPSTVLAWNPTSIGPNGGTSVLTISSQGPSAGKVARIKVTGPAGRPQVLAAYC